MGIRFACPNGHPLHVKQELAGKRGICPECQARFVIPVPGSAQPAAAAAPKQPVAAPASAQPAAASPKAKPTTAPVPPPTPQPPEPAIPASKPEEVIQWYIRPAGGGQFGPADDALLEQWVAEGRVAADSMVWRTGWADWRRASDAGGPLAAKPRDQSDTKISVPGQLPTKDASTGEAATESSVAVATAKYQRRRKRAHQGQMLAAIMLILLTLVLAGVLGFVVYKTSGSSDTSPEQPATTQTNDSDRDEPEEDAPAEEDLQDGEEPEDDAN